MALTHSNSSAALTIFTDDKPRLDCAENKVKVFFAAKPGSSFNISYFVSSGGAILANGFDQVNIGDVSVEDEFVDGSTNIVLGESQKPDDLIVGKHEIVLQRPFLDEGKVAKTIKVKSNCSNWNDHHVILDIELIQSRFWSIHETKRATLSRPAAISRLILVHLSLLSNGQLKRSIPAMM